MGDEPPVPDPDDTLEPDSAEAAGADAIEELARGTSLGRYVVLERIGEGGMGVVYAAWDSALDRKVALKLLRPDTQGENAAARQSRLLREAKAMARLSNPNVNTVHDVGTYKGRVFVAMELVEGTTLATWLEGGRRSWEEVRSLFLQAGRGLAAAHGAGLVHRDVKPDNLLVGEDGRVRVSDFGLVGSAGEGFPGKAPDWASDPGPADGKLTRTGVAFGSPAYMAPEQHQGRSTSPATDQFSFCVTLYEALHGQRPFEGETLQEIGASVEAGRVREPRTGRTVPGWLHQIVLRGLSVDAGERYPSMDALLADLERDPARTRRRLVFGIGAGLLVALAVGGIYIGITGGPTPCLRMERHLEGIWGEKQKEPIRRAFQAAGGDYGLGVWVRADKLLDDWAGAWVQERRLACEATHVHGERSPALLDLSMRCLDRRLAEFAALLDVLRQADRGVIERSLQAVDGLAGLEQCVDPGLLTAVVEAPADPRVRGEVEKLEAELARASALTVAGKYKEALELSEGILERAVKTGHEPILAESHLRVGKVLTSQGKYETARESLRSAALAGQACRHDRVAAEAWIRLVDVVGVRLLQREQGQRVAELARSALARIGGDRALESRMALSLGNMSMEEGRLDEAQYHLERALHIREQDLGPDHPDVATALNRLSYLYSHRRQYDEAEKLIQRELAIQKKVYGEVHPVVAYTLSELTGPLLMQGHYDQALALLQQSLGIFEKTLDPNHPAFGDLHNRFAMVYLKKGDLAGAVASLERALANRRLALGAYHPRVADILRNLGVLHYQRGELDRALEVSEEAALVLEKARNSKDPGLAKLLYLICGIHRAQGCHRKGLEYCERSRDIWEKVEGGDPQQLAVVLAAIGQAHLGLSEHEKAVEPLRRAEELYVQAKSSDLMLSEARFELARALWGSGGDRRKALRMAKEAAAVYLKQQDSDPAQKSDMLKWLAERANGPGKAEP